MTVLQIRILKSVVFSLGSMVFSGNDSSLWNVQVYEPLGVFEREMPLLSTSTWGSPQKFLHWVPFQLVEDSWQFCELCVVEPITDILSVTLRYPMPLIYNYLFIDAYDKSFKYTFILKK